MRIAKKINAPREKNKSVLAADVSESNVKRKPLTHVEKNGRNDQGHDRVSDQLGEGKTWIDA